MFGYTKFIDYLTVINGLRIPVGNLGLSRTSMPQVDDEYQEAFWQYLESQGITVTQERVRISSLRLTQNEVNKFKVWAMMRILRHKKQMPRIWVSSDHYVVDGSHRFVAALNMDGRQHIKVNKANVPAMKFVEVANRFQYVKHRTVSDTRRDFFHF